MPEDEPRATIWIVDDSSLQGELTRRVLADAFETEVFADAMSMLERLEHGAPDVLVVDWLMPEMSGLEACTFVRKRADRLELPILVLTANGNEDDLLEGLAAGANDFVVKPVRAAELIARVTSLVRSRQLLQRAVHAEKALREEAGFRERFLAILAHDLRQPLNVFAMGTAVLSVSERSGPIANVVQRFANASARMQRMLDTLLDFSRSRQRHGIPIVRQHCDLAEVIERVVDEIRHAHPVRRIDVTREGDLTGLWDADRVAQVVSNLVGNALEHSPPGTAVRVEVRATEDRAVLFSVVNEGARIPAAFADTMFDPFRQGAPSRRGGGLGLGLYIVRQIALAHGGDVAVESNDVETRFTVRLLH